MKLPLCMPVAAAILILVASSPSHAFMKEGCGGGECADCHSLTREDAAILLSGTVDNVLKVEPSTVGGLWVVDIVKGEQKWPVYIDFSKKYLINGQIIQIATKENVTESRYQRMNTVDVSTIPLADAIVIGNPKAKRRIIEFSDPDCHFCAKLHAEAKKVVAADPDVAFYVKLYSPNNNRQTVEKILSVICGKQDAQKRMDDAFAGRPLPKPTCRTSAVEETALLARQLRLRGTPTMVLPDGRVINGYRDADAILKFLKEDPQTAGQPSGR
ncbi:MAG: DsbC family protein [Candidatus Deferrimicrobiaceae bacterium]